MKEKDTRYKKYEALTFSLSKEVTRQYSTSFFSATQLFPSAVKEAIYSIYGFVRAADEIVDSFQGFDQKVLFDRFEEDYYFAREQGLSSNPIIHSFLVTVNRYNIDNKYVESFLSSMRSDLDKNIYSTKLETDQYIYGSADVVGLMCLKVFCDSNEQLFEKLLTPAMRLGSAFQKVNFLRDLREDMLHLGRIYFPDLSIASFDDNTKLKLVNDIEKDFSEALTGIKQLPSNSRLAVFTAYRYYKRLLEKISKTPASEIINRRIRVANADKMRLFTYSIIRNKFHLDED